jgi:hypothetical protein
LSHGKSQACPSGQNRPKSDGPSNHLRDHLRLAEPHRNRADEAAEQQDDSDLEEKLNSKVEIVRR